MRRPNLEPFQLQTPIPEIGAEPGDWITLDRGTSPPQLVLLRRIPQSKVNDIRRTVEAMSGFLAQLPHRKDPEPVGKRRMEVVL